MTVTASVSDEPDFGYPRLESQLRWYDSKSQSAQRWYKSIKFIEVACAALVPFIAKIDGNVTALLGAVVLILEMLQQINQWQSNWITYRSTCEALRHEKYSYLGGSGVYDGLDSDPSRRMLVERVESLISTEHAKWISRQEYDPKKAKKG